VRVALVARGSVQGVGFRPSVVRLAMEGGLVGWVRNAPAGVQIQAQGLAAAVDIFVAGIEALPRPAHVAELTRECIGPVDGEDRFVIRESDQEGAPAPSIPPDLAMCAACEHEVLDPEARRSGYPFTTCTACGPRYTIFQAFPFDRERTAMVAFPLCPDCMVEYTNPADRRYHAQAVACPVCGPRLRLLDADGSERPTDDPIADAAAALREGAIVALKGLGGFQLLVDARSDAAVLRLRERKGRAGKPLALMFPSLADLRSACAVEPEEEELLTGPAAPIVLLVPRPEAAIAPSVHPGVPRTGAMLPTTPLHRLLCDRFGGPLVCTSGNRSDEPICRDADEALARLSRIADLLLDHDRPVLRPVDDSVVRVVQGAPLLMRRARGWAPEPIRLPSGGAPVLALGAHLKNTTALCIEDQAVLSPHVGDLDDRLTVERFEEVTDELVRCFGVQPEAIACDMHPDYTSTRYAEELARRWELPLVRVQHHHAHIAAVALEHDLRGPVLGLAWDGTGYGGDGTVWGGETLLCDGPTFQRVGTLRSFALPGGDAASRQPARVALGMLAELDEPPGSLPGAQDLERRLEQALGASALPVVRQMLARDLGSPRTTAMGRLFDGIAFLAGLRGRCSFEAQAAMELEAAAERGLALGERRPYPLPLVEGTPTVADWRATALAVLTDRADGVCVERIAARFHLALADLAVEFARPYSELPVAISGGCFQNGVLARLVPSRLEQSGRTVYQSRRVPPNDGGLALGQLAVARAQRTE
jgi:hydrogenase maturation protein HypF